MSADKPRLHFFVGSMPCFGGGERLVRMAFGTNGTMWIDPREVGIGPEHADQLKRFPGGLYLLINPTTREVMVNARAVIEVMDSPDRRSKWLAYVESMIQEYNEVRARHEATRNN